MHLNASAGSEIAEERRGVECDVRERWVEVEEVREAVVNDVSERLEKVSATESQIPSNADILQCISGSEDKLEERPLLFMRRIPLKIWRILFGEVGL